MPALPVASARFGAYDPVAPPDLPGPFATIVRAEPVVIAAPPEAVWRILVDTPAYGGWCPFTRDIVGDLRVGETIALHLHWGPHLPLPVAASVVQREEVTIVDPPRALAWATRIPGLRAERLQYLEPLAGTGTRYHTYDRFSGPLAPLVMALYRRRIHAGFTAVGAALKRRAEGVG